MEPRHGGRKRRERPVPVASATAENAAATRVSSVSTRAGSDSTAPNQSISAPLPTTTSPTSRAESTALSSPAARLHTRLARLAHWGQRMRRGPRGAPQLNQQRSHYHDWARARVELHRHVRLWLRTHDGVDGAIRHARSTLCFLWLHDQDRVRRGDTHRRTVLPRRGVRQARGRLWTRFVH